MSIVPHSGKPAACLEGRNPEVWAAAADSAIDTNGAVKFTNERLRLPEPHKLKPRATISQTT